MRFFSLPLSLAFPSPRFFVIYRDDLLPREKKWRSEVEADTSPALVVSAIDNEKDPLTTAATTANHFEPEPLGAFTTERCRFVCTSSTEDVENLRGIIYCRVSLFSASKTATRTFPHCRRNERKAFTFRVLRR